MGSPISQVAQPISQQSNSGGKGFAQPTQQSTPNPADVAVPDGTAGQQIQPMGKGGRVTYPGQGGQPQMGQPNNYSNTVGGWDNASIQPQAKSGKGKGY
jgi:hypothetical protein